MPLGYEYYEKIIYDNSKNYINTKYTKIDEKNNRIKIM